MGSKVSFKRNISWSSLWVLPLWGKIATCILYKAGKSWNWASWFHSCTSIVIKYSITSPYKFQSLFLRGLCVCHFWKPQNHPCISVGWVPHLAHQPCLALAFISMGFGQLFWATLTGHPIWKLKKEAPKGLHCFPWVLSFTLLTSNAYWERRQVFLKICRGENFNKSPRIMKLFVCSLNFFLKAQKLLDLSA